MSVRLWDPERDAPGALAELWNEYYGSNLWGVHHFERINPHQTIVGYDDGLGRLVASAFLLDAGPHATLDDIVVLPGKWRFAVLRDVLQFAERLTRDLGLPYFTGVLNMNGGEAEKLVDVLGRRGHFPLQYLGERPMFVRRLSDGHPATLPATPRQQSGGNGRGK